MRENHSGLAPHPHVLIFDSGVGGLSIAREVRAAHPECRLTYASDNRFFPYGEKASEELVARVEKVMEALLARTLPDVAVIACNTASTITLPRLRQRFPTPFVGVVPAIKPAATLSISKTIGVLATPATVARPYTRQLIDDYAAGCSVILQGSSLLVRQAENKLTGQAVDTGAIAAELRRLLERPEAEELDTIVLACTHFPLLQTELEQAALPRAFRWVDSGEAIARRVGYWLDQSVLERSTFTGTHSVVLTAPSADWPALANRLPFYLGSDRPAQLEILEV